MATALSDRVTHRSTFVQLGVIAMVAHFVFAGWVANETPLDSNGVAWLIALVPAPWVLSLCAFYVIRNRSRSAAIFAFALAYPVSLISALTAGVALGLLTK